MRSPTTKSSSTKCALSKTLLKPGSTKKIKKNALPSKKIKKVMAKNFAKRPKKLSKDSASSKDDEESSDGDKKDSSEERNKSKSNMPRNESSIKKDKKILPEKQENIKGTSKKASNKKSPPIKPKSHSLQSDLDDCVKYKINANILRKGKHKTKSVVKNVVTNRKKKAIVASKSNIEKNESELGKPESGKCLEKPSSTVSSDKKNDPDEEQNSENKIVEVSSPQHSASAPTLPETPKSDVERPPKFFTSSRSPRMVDIDVKCFRTSKGNLAVSERFLPLKCETKSDENISSSSSSSTLVSQGPDIDVYTFTDKVDSPKSILSDFRNPLNKNVGRVRPIARVKGTVIDKKIETEKKKFSPNRQIEEVVKQLKANKRSEDIIKASSSASEYVSEAINKTTDNTPKAIASKSYKMVARKSNITGKPYSPIKFLDNEKTVRIITKTANVKAIEKQPKKQRKIYKLSDEDIDSSKFSFNTSRDTSPEKSVSESNDDNDTKESSGSDNSKSRAKSKKYKRITDVKKNTSKELRELSKDSLIDLKDDKLLIGNEKPSKRRMKLLSLWSGPKKHRMASLNAIAKVHCLYENESRTHLELGLMKTVDKPGLITSKPSTSKKKDFKQKDVEEHECTASESESDKKREESSDSSDETPPQRVLRGVLGIRSAGKYWDPKSSSSSEDSEIETKKKTIQDKKKITSKTTKPQSDKPPKTPKKAGAPVKKKRIRNEVVMDLKDMVVQKRMASLNATAIMAASYEKRSPKSSKDETTSDSCSDESFSQKSKNASSSGVKSEVKTEDTKKEAKKEATDESTMTDNKQKVEVIVNQDTDVTITGVYATHHHEGFCTVSGMQYRISSTSHTQTTATANCEKEGCSPEDGTRYTPLTALSSMQPPAEQPQPQPVADLGSLSRRAGCSSAFSAPSASSHHEPG